MGWLIDGVDGHEGYVTNVLRDGRTSGSTTGGGVVMWDVTSADEAQGWVRRLSNGGVEVVVPWGEVTAWRVICECGWEGSSRPVTDGADGPRYCPEDVEEQLAREWDAHVRPLLGLGAIARMTEQVSELEQQIDAAVDGARAQGVSWAAIGEAAGLTRQGAQQRWARPAELTCPACRQLVKVTPGKYGGHRLHTHNWPGADGPCMNGSGSAEVPRRSVR